MQYRLKTNVQTKYKQVQYKHITNKHAILGGSTELEVFQNTSFNTIKY